MEYFEMENFISQCFGQKKKYFYSAVTFSYKRYIL